MSAAADDGQNSYSVKATLAGLPAAGGTLVFTLADAEDRFRSESNPGCSISKNERTMTCVVRDHTESYPVAFVTRLSGGSLGTLNASIGNKTISRSISE